MNAMKAYQNKARLLKYKYEPFVGEFKQHNDDRILMVNMMEQLLESCKVMEGVENAFICVAFNNAFAKQDETMMSIVTRFTGKVWDRVRWIDGDDVQLQGEGERT